MFGVLSWFVVGSHCQSCHPLNDDPISVFPLHFLMFTKCFMARMFLTWIAAPILPPLDCGGRRRRSDYILLYQPPDPPWMSASADVYPLHLQWNFTLPPEYRLYGVIPDVVFTHQPHFSCCFLSLICLSTNQNIQLIHSLLIRIEWTTGKGILM